MGNGYISPTPGPTRDLSYLRAWAYPNQLLDRLKHLANTESEFHKIIQELRKAGVIE